MSSSISALSTRASNLYTNVSEHVSRNKRAYCALAIAAISAGAYAYFNSSAPLTDVAQKRVDTWCQAYHFDGARSSLKGVYADTTETVDRLFLKTIKEGKIDEMCANPNPGIWDSTSKIKFSDPKRNVLPDFLTFKQEGRLEVLKLLEEYNLIDTTPGARTDYSLLHKVYDVDALKYLLGKSSYFGTRHSINQENAKGLSPLGQIIKMRKSLKGNFDALIEFLYANGANVNYKSSKVNVASPLGIALESYSKEGSVKYDDANTSLSKLVNKLLAKGATLKTTDFYKLSKEFGRTTLTEKTRLYEALRRMAKLNPDVLKKLIANGLDLSAKTPYSSSISVRPGESVEKSLTKPLLFQFLYHLGIDDLYFKSSKDPLQITKNLEGCLSTLTDGFSNRKLKSMSFHDHGRGENLDLMRFVELVDRTPDQNLVSFFKNKLSGSGWL